MHHLILNLFLESGSELVENITSNERFEGVKHVTSLDYGSCVDTKPKSDNKPSSPTTINNDEYDNNQSPEDDYFFNIIVSLSALAVIFGTFVIRRFIKRCVDKAEKDEIATARKKKTNQMLHDLRSIGRHLEVVLLVKLVRCLF